MHVCLCVYVYWETFCAFLYAAVKCMKTNCIFCTAKCSMPYCREQDYAFVSRAYADVCSCPTNVTSHNPEKLHQSHLITHIHDAVLHSAGSTVRLQATELRDVDEWKGFQSTVQCISPTSISLITLPPRHFLWFDNIKERELFSYVFQSVVLALPPALSTLVGIFNREISFVLLDEGHFENSLKENSKFQDSDSTNEFW